MHLRQPRPVGRRITAVAGMMLAAAACGGVALPATAAAAASKVSVTTYHNDNLRTGWNQSENALTPSAIANPSPSATFELLHYVALDDQVDAQPLVIPNVTLSAGSAKGSKHDVVYVATENNSVYAIDASSGTILLRTNLGPSVPAWALPGGCNNNGPNVGINSTPAIDPTSNTLYVMAYTFDGGTTPTFRLHALSLTSLADKATPSLVTATAPLNNGSRYNFNAGASRQRAALLLANGNIYAGFASFCDIDADQSRGWMLGWNATTLAPLPANKLIDAKKRSTNTFFLSSIWMSGYGPAADASGNIYFVTGNSDPSGNSYNSVINLAESAVQLSPDLVTVKSFFTPTGATVGHAALDEADYDFGSGGIMLLPPQAGAASNLAVALGKIGELYLLNADSLGNHAGGSGHALQALGIGGCWCGESYFTGADGIGRVVTSGGNNAVIWRVQTGAKTKLVQENVTGTVPGFQDPGFFTSVSSNGTQPGTAVIWAVSRPVDTNPSEVDLYAFDGATGATLYTGFAGNWPNITGDSDLVPVVANGKVYVAANQALTISGIGAASAAAARPVLAAAAAVASPALAAGMHEVWGTVRDISGNTLTLEKRDHQLVTVDSSVAMRKFKAVEPSVGHALDVQGTLDASGVLKATLVLHAKDAPSMWQPDR